MSQRAAVSSASLARSSPRCQACSSLPRLPSGCSRLWSGPATKPSSEIDIWQVVSDIAILSKVPAIASSPQTTRRRLDDRVRLAIATFALVAAFTPAAPAGAHPCDPAPSTVEPHRWLVDAFGVLERPAPPGERPPRSLAEFDG